MVRRWIWRNFGLVKQTTREKQKQYLRLHFWKPEKGYNVSVHYTVTCWCSCSRHFLFHCFAAFLGFVEMKTDQSPSLTCLIDLEILDRFITYLKVKCTSTEDKLINCNYFHFVLYCCLVWGALTSFFILFSISFVAIIASSPHTCNIIGCV